MNKKNNLRIICILPTEIIYMILECLGTDFLITNDKNWGVLTSICKKIIKVKSKKIIEKLIPLYNIVFSDFKYAFSNIYLDYRSIKGSTIILLNNKFISHKLFEKYCKDLNIIEPHNKSLKRVIDEFNFRRQSDYLFKNDLKFYETSFLSQLIEYLNI